MQIQKNASFSRLILLSLLIAPLLSACFKQKEPEIPFDEVMRNAKQATMDIEFGSLAFNVSLDGQDATEKVKGKAKIDFSFDRSGDTPEQQLKIKGEGQLTSDQQKKGLNLEVTFLEAKEVVQDHLYMHLDALDLTGNDGFEGIKPIIEAYTGKWVKIPPEKLPASFQQFQVQQDLLQQEKELAKQVFVTTKLFDLQEYKGVEKVGSANREAYHYTVSLNEEGVRNYNQQVAQVLGNEEPTEEELQKATAGLKYIQSLDLWVDVQDYRVVQAKLVLGGADLFQTLGGKDMQLEIDLDMTSDFATPVNLEAPKDFLELDALGAFTQAAQLPVVQNVQLDENSEDLQNPLSTTGPQGFDDGN